MFDLAREGTTDELARNVDAGVPVNLTDASGNTLVMLAAYHGQAATVTALTQRGADPNRGNDKGQTPLAGAVFKGARDVVEALVAAGADPNQGAPSALEAARYFGKDDLIGLLGG
jgi:ankyrin repeat protein